ncbi:MAG TPA: OsmC family protein [Blastocatellia bacterium]|nr:OsmC family protein [Blastocatellia bacterium]
MSDVRLNWEGGLKFTATGNASVPVRIDGDKHEGASPMELVLAALGGCTSIDIVAILGKMRQSLDRFEIELTGSRRDTDPKAYSAIELIFKLWGEGLEKERVSRAVELSLSKYCSVLHSLSKEIKLTTKIIINPQP